MYSGYSVLPGGVLSSALVSPPHVVLVLLVKVSDPELGAESVVYQMDEVLTIQTESYQQVRTLDVLVDVTLAVDVLETVEHLERDGAGRFHGEPITL